MRFVKNVCEMFSKIGIDDTLSAYKKKRLLAKVLALASSFNDCK